MGAGTKAFGSMETTGGSVNHGNGNTFVWDDETKAMRRRIISPKFRIAVSISLKTGVLTVVRYCRLVKPTYGKLGRSPAATTV